MTPRHLKLDFVDRAPRVRAATRAFALTALLVAVAAGIEYQQVADSVQAREDALALRSEPTAKTGTRGKAKDATPTPAELRPELAVGWSALLSDLEHAARDHHDRIALLAVEPDRQKQSVRLRGQARSLEDVLAFVQRLAGIPRLAHPMLESHETRVEDPQRPIEFGLAADWSAGA